MFGRFADVMPHFRLLRAVLGYTRAAVLGCSRMLVASEHEKWPKMAENGRKWPKISKHSDSNSYSIFGCFRVFEAPKKAGPNDRK